MILLICCFSNSFSASRALSEVQLSAANEPQSLAFSLSFLKIAIFSLPFIYFCALNTI
jgi:hypothetical protein